MIVNVDGIVSISINFDVNMLLSIGSDVVVLYSNWENCFGGVSCLDFKCVGGVWIV